MLKMELQTVLNDKDLVIKYVIDETGKTYFVGQSQRYYPYTATSSDPIRCFFKFEIPLHEQKRLALSMKTALPLR
jgi:hypothetical protein